jgi:hypothetical protein
MSFEGIVDTLPALQDLAPVWRSLLAVTSDVTHIMCTSKIALIATRTFDT